ncbi:sialoadhesin-like [Poeciliopsis prolifica]|uniref:sialoadhesin-like n=1 Tax=Poeciliopsis prolifica TaxID=188132 RepID=UPI0024144CB2|nr:sialoadhesin-like [Poeciliopsis prolifica]
MLSTLTVTPDRSQFFQYDQITLTCVTNSSGWKVMSTIKTSPLQERQFSLAISKSCTIEDAYPTDTGVYWCQSEQGECSNRVNITVTEGSVILKSPSCPVFEGENVTLGCFYKENGISTSNFEAAFYKDDVFIGKEKRGKMTIKAEEGFYKCVHPSKGESPKSWLAVKGVASSRESTQTNCNSNEPEPEVSSL